MIDIFDQEAERAVLGSCLIDHKMIQRLVGIIRAEDFYLPDHARVYGEMLKLGAEKSPTDMLVLRDRLGDAFDLLLMDCLISTPVSYNAPYYAKIVLRHSRRRMVMDAGQALAAPGDDPDQAISEAEAVLLQARRRQIALEWESKSASLDELYRSLTGPLDEKALGLQTGLSDLDEYLCGFRPGQFYVIGARPRIGKTSLMTTITHHAALRAGVPVLFFSVEMTRRDIWEKMLSIELQIPWKELTSHHLTPDQQERLEGAVGMLQEAEVDVIPAREWTVQQIRAAARKSAESRHPALICVDYAQEVKHEGRFENRTQLVGAVSSGLKDMAMELECPVLSASQLNRRSADRPNQAPTLEDLRESGNLEQDASAVILLHREQESSEDGGTAETSEVIANIAKNRWGQEGVVRLGYRGKYMQFVNYKRDYPGWGARDGGRG